MENVTAAQVKDALERVIASFQTVLYEDDEQFLENMKTKNLEGDDIRRYQHWEWTQGVGLYGFWRLFEATKKPEYLDILKRFYEKQMEVGLPGKNINTVTPLLAMSYFAEYTKNDEYLAICDEWAESIMHDFVRTEEGGLQHKTSDTMNNGELWDDTLFMTVLFLANMGRIRGKKEYIEEAQYQFILDFAAARTTLDDILVRQVLTLDYYLRDYARKRPSFALEQDSYKEEVRAVCLKAFPESSYKDVIRDYHIEVFVPPFTDEKQFVLFDYQHRDPLDQNAEIRKI